MKFNYLTIYVILFNFIQDKPNINFWEKLLIFLIFQFILNYFLVNSKFLLLLILFSFSI